MMPGVVCTVPEMSYTGCHMYSILPLYSTKGFKFQCYLGRMCYSPCSLLFAPRRRYASGKSSWRFLHGLIFSLIDCLVFVLHLNVIKGQWTGVDLLVEWIFPRLIAMTDRIIASRDYGYKAILGKVYLMDRERLITVITKDELVAALNPKKNGKPTNLGVLSCEFFKRMWGTVEIICIRWPKRLSPIENYQNS